MEPQQNVSWSSLSFAQVSGSRDLMQLEGGPLTIAIGAGDVYRVLNNPDFGAQQDGLITQPGGPTYAVGSQNNANAYVELAAPVLKTLEIDAALRYDHYNVPNANTWNPKLGVKWTPIQQLALRGTAGTGFRAPWIAEAGNAGALFQPHLVAGPAVVPRQPSQRQAQSRFTEQRYRAGQLLQLQLGLFAVQQPELGA